MTFLGNNTFRLPKNNDSVLIPAGQYVVIDCALPSLNNLQIDGTVEFDNKISHYLEVNVS